MDDRKKSKRKYFILILILIIIVALLCIVSVSYAVVYTALNIRGSSSIYYPTWDIGINNVKFNKTGMVTYTKPVISNTTINDFKAVLSYPGDKLTMNFDIVNNGNINSKLEYYDFGKVHCTYKKTGLDASNFCNNFNYNVTYSNGSKIGLGDNLDAGQSEKVTVTLEYEKDGQRIMDDAVVIDGLDFVFVYGQR